MTIWIKVKTSFSFLILMSVICGFSTKTFSEFENHDRGKRIEESKFITLGRLEQWVTIRGDNNKSPILLLLHGGPADAQSMFVESYVAFEKDFILVQWDQRGSGKTFEKLKDQTPNLTLDQLVNDGIELVIWLKQRFKENGVIVMGHSWGTAIATEMVQKHPELFLAYVGTGQIASWAESVHWQFDFLKRKALTTNDEKLLKQLNDIGTPDPKNTTQYFGFTRSLRSHMNFSDSSWLATMRKYAFSLPKDELDVLAASGEFSSKRLLPFQMQEELSTKSLVFQLPYFIIQGEDDLFTPTDPVIAYFDKVSAPKKDLTIIRYAGHFALVTHQKEFVSALIRMVARIEK